MIGLDTNVLVRYIVRDDTVQTELATRLVGSLDESEPGFISVIALVETVWYHDSRLRALVPESSTPFAVSSTLPRSHT